MTELNITQEQYDADIRAAKSQAIIEAADALQRRAEYDAGEEEYAGMQESAGILRDLADEIEAGK